MITGIDHIVLTVRDIESAVTFYGRVLGLEAVTFAKTRRALQVGDQKINLQSLGMETRNNAAIGSGDLCLLTSETPEAIIANLKSQGVDIVEGPVTKTGAKGPFTSVYFNDPDGNLIEVSHYT